VGEDSAVQRLIDRVDIIEGKNAYARAADALDPDRMIELFTDDCSALYHPGGEPIRGREQLRDWYRQRLGPVVASSHHLSNFEVTFTGDDSAELRCYLYSWQRFKDFPEQRDRHRWSRYFDTWVRTANGWRQRSLTLLVAGELSSEADLRIGEYLGRPEW
jgi:uncharacterized protein (TIGR02246 family)